MELIKWYYHVDLIPFRLGEKCLVAHVEVSERAVEIWQSSWNLSCREFGHGYASLCTFVQMSE